MKEKYDHIFIDVMNMYWRAYSANKHLSTQLPDGTILVTGGVYTSIKMLQKVKRDLLEEDGLIYLLFEGGMLSTQDLPMEKVDGARSFRKNLDPDYKSNRDNKSVDPGFYRALNTLETVLLNFDDQFVCVQIPDMEADDLVQPLLTDIPKEDSVLLMSNDLDWARAIQDNVHWLRNDQVLTPIEFQEEYGFRPRGVELYKTFRGDGSDNIPKGVPGIRENILVQLIEDFGSLKDVLINLGSIDYLNDTWKKKIEENKARLRLNQKLVEFYPITSSYLKKFIFPCEYSPRTLYELYILLGFNVEKLDNRVLSDIHVMEKGVDGFFEYEKTNRL